MREPMAYPMTDPPVQEPVWLTRLLIVRDVLLIIGSVVVIVLVAGMAS